MKKIISLIILSCILTVNANAATYDINDSTCRKEGEWTVTNSEGYNGQEVYSAVAGATLKWEISEPVGIYRVFFWKSIDENGSKTAKVTYASENQDIVTRDVDMSRGNAGWQEIGCFGMLNAGADIGLYADDGTMFASAIKVESLPEEYNSLISLANGDAKSILLKVNERKCFVGGLEKTIPDVAPTIVNNRTLLPIRFISESMGAEVSWDAAQKKATIALNGDILEFVIGSKEFISNGETKTLDQPAEIINDRTMLPIRVISEELDKKVAWHESGIIAISDYLEDDMLAEIAEDFKKIFN